MQGFSRTKMTMITFLLVVGLHWFQLHHLVYSNLLHAEKQGKKRKKENLSDFTFPPPCLETIETKLKVQPRSSSFGYLWLISMETFHFLLKGKIFKSDKWPQSDGLWHLWEEFKEQKQCQVFLLYIFLLHFYFTPFIPILFHYNYSFSFGVLLSNKTLNLRKNVITCLQTRVYSLWYPI